MADEKPLIIPIDSIEKDFEDFLSPDTNTRIIFSGPFGIGKTYFLDKFFKNKNKKYLPIFLRPVNYSLLSNEDVFRLIKYDILFQIIKDRQFIFDDIPDFTKMEFAQFFASQNLFLPLVNLLKTLPKIKTLVTGAEEIEKLITKYSEGLRQINKNEKLSVLSEFRTEAETNFLLEYDHVSQLIADQLDEIAKKDDLQKVLIIDDLDRLDPDHIFRLFNVFSAHFDHVNYYSNREDVKDSKFGFDKIIFVCDIENIRKLFAHKYGLGVDFSGYIDKFYSKRIFYLFHEGMFDEYILPHIKNKLNSTIRLGLVFEKTFRAFYQLIFEGNQLNIRDILRLGDLHVSKLIDKRGKLKIDEIQLNKINAPANASIKSYPICIVLNIFSLHFGSSTILKDKIIEAFHSANAKDDDFEAIYEYRDIFHNLILFADYKKHNFKKTDDFSFMYESIPYKINSGFDDPIRQEGVMWYRVEIIDEHLIINKGSFYKLLTQASINILESGILC